MIICGLIMKELQISKDLSLPLNAVTQVHAFLGRRSSGKTFGSSKLAELMLEAKAQIVVLDVAGSWWGLRQGKDGVSPGFPIPVFGGLHGDVPIDSYSGTVVADLIVDQDYSAVIDISQMIDSEQHRFAYDFARQLFQKKKEKPSAIHIFLEEAQELTPQNPEEGEKKMLHAFNRMVKLGRNFGIGVTLISQRPQEVNKKVLNQVECLFAFQMTGPHERKAVQGWIADKGIDEDIYNLLPKLEIGQPHAWSPQWLKISKKIKISEKKTFDSSATPEVGAKRVEVKNLSPVDIEQVTKALKNIVEEKKENDPKLLKNKIRDLEQQVKFVEDEAKRAEIFAGQIRSKLEQENATLRDHKCSENIFDSMLKTQLKSKLNEVIEISKSIVQDLTSPSVSMQGLHNESLDRHLILNNLPVVEYKPVNRKTGQVKEMNSSAAAKASTIDLPKGERIVLTLVAQQNGRCTREMVAVFTEYSTSTRNTYIQKLQQKGYIEFKDKNIKITDVGLIALGDYEALPTGKALQEFWLRTLPKGESAILNYVLRAHPGFVTRHQISSMFEYSDSTRNTYIQKLATKKLIHAGRQSVKANDYLF